MRNSLPLSSVVSFCSEMIPEHGEDSFCYSFCDSAGMVAVFDGCGGAGARKHECFTDHTEAYIASRLCAGAFYDFFGDHFPTNEPLSEAEIEALKSQAINLLKLHEPSAGSSGFSIRGSMVRTLPTTVACAIMQRVSNSQMDVTALWAGDSRVFIMDAGGLSQMSIDDTTIPDPMENLYEDGVLQNIFCSDRKVELRQHTVRVGYPCVVLAATDGCFGYVTTPMEFEGILLYTLLKSETPEQWENEMKDRIRAVSGDDHTLCLAAFGFKDFKEMKQYFNQRYNTLYSQYLEPVSKMELDDQNSRKELWLNYKPGYCRYMKDGIVDGSP